jgi:hypothetical protein
MGLEAQAKWWDRDGRGCPIQETRLHETRKKDERKSARVQRPIQREGGNTEQAGKETAHKEK